MDYALAGFKCVVPRQKEIGAMSLSVQKKLRGTKIRRRE